MHALIRLAAFAIISFGVGVATSFASTAPLAIPNLQIGTSGGRITVIVPLADGKILIGGGFERVNGIVRKGIARLNPDGSLDGSWNADLDFGDVEAILVNGSFVYLGGSFSQVGGQPRRGLARVALTDGAVSMAWSADVNARAYALATDGTDLFVGGNFSTIGGQDRVSLARVSLSSGAVSAWTNDVTLGSGWGDVYSLALDGANLYVGGRFESVGGQPRSGLARVSLAGSNSADPAWNASIGSSGDTVLALAVFGAHVYAGGSFIEIGGAARRSVARISTATGVVDAGWSPPANMSTVSALLADSSGVIAATTLYDTQARLGVAELDLSTGAITSWDPGAATDLRWTSALAFTDGYVLVGETGPRQTPTLMRFIRGGALDGSVRASAGSEGAVVLAIAFADDGSAYLGGQFSGVEGHSITNLLRVRADGTVDTSWRPDPDDLVNEVVLSGADLLVAGNFTRIGGVARNALAKVSTGVGALVDPAWNPNPNGSVLHLLADGGYLFVTGPFSSISGAPSTGIAKISIAGSGASDPGWNAAWIQGNQVQAMALGGGSLFLGGNFLVIGENTRELLKISPASGARDASWNPSPSSSVYALAYAGGQIFAAGDFRAISGVVQPYVARIDAANGAVDPNWMPRLNREAIGIAERDGVLYVDTQAINGRRLSGSTGAISASSGRPDFAWSADPFPTTMLARSGQLWLGFPGRDTIDARSAVAAYPLAACTGQPDGTSCDAGPGVSGGSCQASICTPALATTSTTLSATVTPGPFGPSATLNASVSSSGPTAVGSVTFYDQAGNVVGFAYLSGGSTSTTAFGLSNSSRSIVAIYDGSEQHAPSRSTPLNIATPNGSRDINGDGKGDVFWRKSDGANYVWHINGAVITGGVVEIASQGLLPSADMTWWVAGIGDFNGDGKADVLWRNASGSNYVWHLDGSTITNGMLTIISQGLLPSVAGNWTVAGIGDFNGDGKSDILWRDPFGGANYLWMVDGATLVNGVFAISSQGLLPSVDASWEVARLGDFNGDGKADIFWRKGDGTNYVWHIDGANINGGVVSISSQGLLPVVDNTWAVVASGDYNGDGKSDVFFRKADGTNYVWHLNGAVISGGMLQIQSQGLLPAVDTSWEMVGQGDYNGDGKSDVLWRKTDGTNYIWNIDGATIAGGMITIASQGLLPSVDPSWTVVNPK